MITPSNVPDSSSRDPRPPIPPAAAGNPKWELRNGRIDFSAGPLVMGVLNVTPDSFSDGGLFRTAEAALRRADEMVAQGASLIDVGPESTRPGSDPVPPAEQIARMRPIIAAVRRSHPRLPISIDTRSAAVAAEAIALGADIINDVSALRDDEAMPRLAAETRAPVILMHMRGRPKTMQTDPAAPAYDDVVNDIIEFLRERIAFAVERGISRERLAVDPGIGFGKTTEHNLTILRRLAEFGQLGLPLVLGASRKRFIGQVLDQPDPSGRLIGSLACTVVGVLAGAAIIRTHDVRETVDAVRMVKAIQGWETDSSEPRP